jgi:hypothetical protein
VQAFSFQCCSRPGATLLPPEGWSRAWHCLRAAGSCRVCSVGTELFAYYRRTIPIRKRIIKTASPRSKARQKLPPSQPPPLQIPGPPGTATNSHFIQYHVGPTFPPLRNTPSIPECRCKSRFIVFAMHLDKYYI